MVNEIILVWSIRLSLLCYATALGCLILGRAETSKKWISTVGLMLLFVHLLFAYESHGWSHARAVEQTAVDTKQTLGFEFGAGIYFNHIFAIVWLIDAVCEWSRMALPRTVRVAIHAYLVLIAMNGAIVFESGPTRWAGLLALVLLGALAWAQRNARRS